MIITSDEYVCHEENDLYEIAVSSVKGTRERQEDCAGFVVNGNEAAVVICDGMGGHEGGREAGRTGVSVFLDRYDESYPCNDPHGLLVGIAKQADRSIVEIKRSDGTFMMAGSTMISVFMRNSILFWLSVGDSRIYIMRGNRIMRVTADHILRNVAGKQFLNSVRNAGQEIDGSVNGDALVSFLGMNGIRYIDSNSSGFEMKSGDRILLCSDGLYKYMNDDNILSVMNKYSDGCRCLEEFEKMVAAERCNLSRDNMTVSVIKYK